MFGLLTRRRQKFFYSLKIKMMKKVLFWIVQCAKSKTIWWNVINLTLLSLEIYFQEFPIDPKQQAVIMSLGNLYLRFLTSKPISDK